MGDVVALPKLEEHIDQCEKNYQEVIRRLDNLDHRMDKIETLAEDIKRLLMR